MKPAQSEIPGTGYETGFRLELLTAKPMGLTRHQQAECDRITAELNRCQFNLPIIGESVDASERK